MTRVLISAAAAVALTSGFTSTASPSHLAPATSQSGASVETVIASFEADGWWPYGSLAIGADGNLYGDTWLGGPGGAHGDGAGTAFELTPSPFGYLEKTLHAFPQRRGDGQDPYGSVTLDARGDMYGATEYGASKVCNLGCGRVFKLVRKGNGYIEKVLHDFSGRDGEYPMSGLTLGRHGVIFGTTIAGGSRAHGTVFELVPSKSGYTEQVLHDFAGGITDGDSPYSTPFVDGDGALYGTTYYGGGKGCFRSYGCGTVWKLTPEGTGYQETVMHRFGLVAADGKSPFSPVIVGSGGVLFGTTAAGGDGCAGGCGTVFELSPSPSGYIERILYAFQGAPDGAGPNSGLLEDRAGDFYGTTGQGGLSDSSCSGCGTVFELTPTRSGYDEAILYRFVGSPNDGRFPVGGLVVDRSGNLYGTTVLGGTSDVGTAFELRPSANARPPL
jgi:uncharacterized repeat protein (TIGR03803 family)